MRHQHLVLLVHLALHKIGERFRLRFEVTIFVELLSGPCIFGFNTLIFLGKSINLLLLLRRRHHLLENVFRISLCHLKFGFFL